MNIIQAYQERIDRFLSSILLAPSTPKPLNSKIIHDSVWGTHTFYSWEVGLIDSPLLQRLRRIHQTGLAYLVFPTATHTRFEHSLGVATLVDSLVHHLNDNKKFEFISENDRYDLRLSALLHDVGHCFFSHLSEMVYSRMPVFQELSSAIREEYEGLEPKGHEIFSFLIVKSSVFQTYFAQLITTCKLDNNNESLKRHLGELDWDKIAGWIIGYSKDTKKKYLAEIINGPFDCDKLDYLARDAKFAGPVIVYDIDRFYYTLDTLVNGQYENLTVTLGGITALEQILISRMMMFSYIYHHHKVRASEAMMKRLCFDIINEKAPEVEGTIKITLNHPVDFLYYTDDIMLGSFSDSYNIPSHCRNIMKDLVNRNLWVRGIFISDFNLEKGMCNPDYTCLEKDLHLKVNIEELKSVKNKIVSEAKTIDPSCPIESRDIWIDVPKSPNSDEVSQVQIRKSHTLTDSVSLTDVFPISAWIAAYKAQKWKSHIFCKKEYQRVVYEASRKLLAEKYEMEVQVYTRNICKIERV